MIALTLLAGHVRADGDTGLKLEISPAKISLGAGETARVLLVARNDTGRTATALRLRTIPCRSLDVTAITPVRSAEPSTIPTAETTNLAR